MKKKSNTLIYVAVIIGLIISAIAATAVVNRTKEQAPSDIRAKAGATSALQMTGTVGSVDNSKGVFSLTDVRFVSSTSETTLGTWSVTPPSGFSLNSLSAGTQVTITINPATMLTSSSTVTATQIIVER